MDITAVSISTTSVSLSITLTTFRINQAKTLKTATVSTVPVSSYDIDSISVICNFSKVITTKMDSLPTSAFPIREGSKYECQ